MKETILGIITGIFYLIFLVSATGVESGSKVPVIMLLVSLAWFAAIVFANRDQLGPLEEYEKYEEDEEDIEPYEEDSMERKQKGEIYDRRKEDKKRA